MNKKKVDAAWKELSFLEEKGLAPHVGRDNLWLFVTLVSDALAAKPVEADPSTPQVEWLTRSLGILDAHHSDWLASQNFTMRLNFCKVVVLARTGQASAAAPIVQRMFETKDKAGRPHTLALQGLKLVLDEIKEDVPGTWTGLETVLGCWESVSNYVLRVNLPGYETARNSAGDQVRQAVHNIVNATNADPQRWFSNRLKAEKEEITETTLYAATLLIDALLERDHPDLATASSIERQLRARRKSLDPLITLRLVREHIHAGNLDQAEELLHAHRDQSSPAEGSTRLMLAAYLGKLDEALNVYNNLEKTGRVFSRDRIEILRAHSLAGSPDATAAFFNKLFPEGIKSMPPPTAHHYGAVVMAYARAGDFVGANRWLVKLVQAGLRPTPAVYNAILSALAKRGEVELASEVFQRMVDSGTIPNVAVYTTIISMYADRRDPRNAERTYERAIAQGIKPDHQMLTALMHAHVRSASWAGVIRTFDFLQSSPAHRRNISIVTFNVLLKAYVMIGAPYRTVSRLFRMMTTGQGIQPNDRSYALLIQSACDSRRMDVASDLFVEMDETIKMSPSHQLRVNVYILTIIMAGYLQKGDLQRAKAVYEEMVSRGIQPSAVTYGTIVQSYVNEGSEASIQTAEEFVRTLTSADSVVRKHWQMSNESMGRALEIVFGPLLDAYNRVLKPTEVLRHFDGMLSAGGKPSDIGLTMLMDAYRRMGELGRVKEVWKQIYDRVYDQVAKPLFGNEAETDGYNVGRRTNALCLPFSIYIDALSAAGEHQAIQDEYGRLRSAGFAFDAHNWNHLAVTMIRAGNPEAAFEILEHVIIPFWERGRRLQVGRDRAPESPYTLIEEDFAEGAEGVVPLGRPEVTEPDTRRMEQRRRASARNQRLAGPYLAETEQETSPFVDDVVHPLHILHQISPSWNFWVPHLVTVRVLATAIDTLDSGHMIVPVGRQRSSLREDGPVVSDEARVILRRIVETTPKAVKWVKDHRGKAFNTARRQRQRLGDDMLVEEIDPF